MDEKLLGKCGYYCGQCPSYLAGECAGCISGNKEGVCYTRDCVIEKISYLVDTVRSFLAKRFRAIQKQAFSVRYGSSGRPIRENINCNCRIELIYNSVYTKSH